MKQVVIPLWAVSFAFEPAHGSVALEGGLGDKIRQTVDAITVSSPETSTMKWEVSLNVRLLCAGGRFGRIWKGSMFAWIGA